MDMGRIKKWDKVWFTENETKLLRLEIVNIEHPKFCCGGYSWEILKGNNSTYKKWNTLYGISHPVVHPQKDSCSLCDKTYYDWNSAYSSLYEKHRDVSIEANGIYDGTP